MYLKNEIDKLLVESKYKEAFNLIEKNLADPTLTEVRRLDLFFLKAWIYNFERLENEKSLEVINTGLLENGENFSLLFLKARIYAYDPKYRNLIFAYDLVMEAQKKFKIYMIKNKPEISNRMFNQDLISGELDNLGHEIENLRVNIINLMAFNDLYNETKNIQKNIQGTEDRFFQERVRIMEIFGLFVAIFAFIFSTIEYTRTFDLIDSIAILCAMGLILTIFLSVLHMVLHRNERAPAFIGLIILLILVILFIIPFASKIGKFFFN